MTAPIPAFAKDVMEELRQKVETGGRHRTIKTFDALNLIKLIVGREEAGRIAIASGEIDAPKWGPALYSEDLW